MSSNWSWACKVSPAFVKLPSIIWINVSIYSRVHLGFRRVSRLWAFGDHVTIATVSHDGTFCDIDSVQCSQSCWKVISILVTTCSWQDKPPWNIRPADREQNINFILKYSPKWSRCVDLVREGRVCVCVFRNSCLHLHCGRITSRQGEKTWGRKSATATGREEQQRELRRGIKRGKSWGMKRGAEEREH